MPDRAERRMCPRPHVGALRKPGLLEQRLLQGPGGSRLCGDEDEQDVEPQPCDLPGEADQASPGAGVRHRPRSRRGAHVGTAQRCRPGRIRAREEEPSGRSPLQGGNVNQQEPPGPRKRCQRVGIPQVARAFPRQQAHAHLGRLHRGQLQDGPACLREPLGRARPRDAEQLGVRLARHEHRGPRQGEPRGPVRAAPRPGRRLGAAGR
mmetsp:Transcript_114958/g.336275  ORF Transcript_114958/g.336275 Transcript_114958/m.336275 type:complete len:207 (-) Transcript_114958:243-863(-)